jgi:hypothetical protein
LDPTPLLGAKRCHARDQQHTSRVVTFLPVDTVNHVQTLNAPAGERQSAASVLTMISTTTLMTSHNTEGTSWWKAIRCRVVMLGVLTVWCCSLSSSPPPLATTACTTLRVMMYGALGCTPLKASHGRTCVLSGVHALTIVALHGGHTSLKASRG